MKKWQTLVLTLIGSAIAAYGLVFVVGQHVPVTQKTETASAVTTSAPVIPPAIPAPAPERPLIDMVNQLRSEQGVAPLTASPALDQSAQEKANDMATQHYFGHISPQGVRGINLIPNYLPTATHGSENLTMCNTTQDNKGAFNAWKNSPAHYKGMIDPSMTLYGTAVAFDEKEQCKVFVNHFAAV